MDGEERGPGIRIALTIAGSDSGGGAGIQADLKTFHQFGVFGTSVVAAVTAQNTLGVRAVHAIPPDIVRAQIDALAADLPPHALKIGMLGTARTVEAVADRIEAHGWRQVVLDPVMVATSGDRLLEPDAERALRDRLLPLCDVVTPNAPEASVLTGLSVRTEDDLARAGERLVELGAGAALVKGGHLGSGRRSDPGSRAGAPLTDVLVTDGGIATFQHERVDTAHTHGTGCTLSAALAAGLAHGRPLAEATRAAVTFVVSAVARAPGLGSGRGPVDHFTPPPPWASPLARGES